MLLELFVVFFKLGAFTIGGGIAMLPLLQDELIYRKKWFTEEEFLDAVAICQGLPGIIAVNMATYVGSKKKGILGSLVATIAVILPSFVIILLIAKGLATIGDNSIVNGVMAGFRAAALGLVLVALFQLGKSVFKDIKAVVSGIIAFILIAIFKINTAYVILLFLVYGVVSALINKKKLNNANPDKMGGDDK